MLESQYGSGLLCVYYQDITNYSSECVSLSVYLNSKIEYFIYKGE